MPVDMLIGADYYWQLVTGKISRGSDGPIAIHTKLGWVLSSPSCSGEIGHCSMNLSTLHADAHTAEPQVLDEQLRAFWELEALGIHDQKSNL